MSTNIPQPRSMREILHQDFDIDGRDMGRFAIYMEQTHAIPALKIDCSSLWIQTKDINGDILYELITLDKYYNVIVEESSREFPRPPLSMQARLVIHDMEERVRNASS